jgi:hypothetical protein
MSLEESDKMGIANDAGCADVWCVLYTLAISAPE